MIFSPLRYPGGKAKLYPFFAELIRENSMFGANYCEPYAGGAGLAIRLLTDGFVETISLNDIDQSIYAFWRSALYNTDKFCSLIAKTPITVEEWYRQKKIWEKGNLDDELKLGFSAFFLNRTNRSGIIDGAGPIGGFDQYGPWKIDVRLNKSKQIENLRSLSRYAGQIEVTNFDALKYLGLKLGRKNTLVYLDPPYYVKGRKLYKNFYEHQDHVRIAEALEKKRKTKWVVSYDFVPEIKKAYGKFAPVTYSLNYSAGRKIVGTEVIFLSDALSLPIVQGFKCAA
ncbi:MAG: DNA adenine methylase [Aestuariivirga sp.]